MASDAQAPSSIPAPNLQQLQGKQQKQNEVQVASKEDRSSEGKESRMTVEEESIKKVEASNNFTEEVESKAVKMDTSTIVEGNNKCTKTHNEDTRNTSNEVITAPSKTQTMAANAEALEPVGYPVPARQSSTKLPGFLDMQQVPTKTEDGGGFFKPSNEGVSGEHRHDGFLLYSNATTRRMAILGLDEDELDMMMVAPDQHMNENVDAPAADENEDQEDVNMDNNEEERSIQRKTRISFEFHQSLFFFPDL